mgnify:CR=1 FL=1|jgi:raffinose/stachyose/melibiose transport system permease protein
MRLKANFAPWLFLFPALFIYLMVIVLPSLYSLVLSFFDWNGVSADKKFVGLGNYISLITEDTVFRTALKNNLIWLIAA